MQIRLFGKSHSFNLFKDWEYKGKYDPDHPTLFDFTPDRKENTEVIEGKQVSRDGKIYEYRRSKKNPFVRRLFSTDKDKVNDPFEGRVAPGQGFDLFSQNKEKAVVRKENAQPGGSKPEAKKPDYTFGRKKPADDFTGDLFSQPAKHGGAPGETAKPATPKIFEREAGRITPDSGKTAGSREKRVLGAEELKGKKQRENYNAKAREILKKKPDEITDEDKKILAKYSGKGNLSAENLDDVSLNEFYTRKQEVRFIWKMLEKLGFKGGLVLEPSCGVGQFIEHAPDNALVTGVEIDDTSGKIAEILHPDHDIRIQSFEDFNRRSDGGVYDAVIGNVPFGVRGLCASGDPDYVHETRHERYFVQRSIDACREGGLIGLIVPTGIMSNQINDWRLEVNKKAEFLGAIRMPTGAFKHAHAEVTTDIVFFRKRPDAVTKHLNRLRKPEEIKEMYDKMILDADFVTGNFFSNNREYLLGKPRKNQWGDYIWEGEVTDKDLEKAGEFLKTDADDYNQLGINYNKFPDRELQTGDVKELNGRFYRLNENHRWERLTGEQMDTEQFLKSLDPDTARFARKHTIRSLEELRAFREDYTRHFDLSREDMQTIPIYDGEIQKYASTSLLLDKALKDGVIIGLAVKRFVDRLRDKVLSSSDATREAERLKLLVEDFVRKHGHPVRDLQFNRYYGKSERKPLVYLASSLNDEGKPARIFDNPLEYFKDYQKSDDVGDYNRDDYISIVKYLFENDKGNGLSDIAKLFSFRSGIPDIQSLDRALLLDDEIFVIGNNYIPRREAIAGEVYEKIESWETMIAYNRELLDDQHTSPEKRERCQFLVNKLEKQITDLRAAWDYKTLDKLPILLSDAVDLIGYQRLNEFVKEYVDDPGISKYPLQIYNLSFGSLVAPEDENLKRLYQRFLTLESEDDKEKKEAIKGAIKAEFGDLFPVLFHFLNEVNGIRMKDRTKEAKEKEKAVSDAREKFKEFLADLPDAGKIEDSYNRLYNNFIQKQYDSSPIEGIAKLDYDKVIYTDPKTGKKYTVREKIGAHQWQTVRRMYDQGKGMIAHGVGLGKTAQAVILTMLAKETGRAKKPIIICPKALVKNWHNEYQKWGKNVNVLVVGLKETNKLDENGDKIWVDETKEEKIAKLLQIESGEYDAIVMHRDLFESIDFSQDTKKKLIEELRDKFIPAGVEKKSSKAQKEQIERIEGKIAQMLEEGNRLEGITIESLGFDMIIRDECHDTKNLFAPMDDIKGISTAQSTRAIRNFMLTKYIKANNKNKNVYMLTATPVSNSPLEVFNMMAPIADEELRKMNILNIDDFIKRFASIGTELGSDTDGKVRDVAKFKSWMSPEIIRNTFFRFIDFKTADDVVDVKTAIKFPKEKPNHILVEPNELQGKILKDCKQRIRTLKFMSIERDESGAVIKFELDTGKLEGAVKNGFMTEAEKDDIINFYKGGYKDRYKSSMMKGEPDHYFKVMHDMIKATTDLDWYRSNKSSTALDVSEQDVSNNIILPKVARLVENVKAVHASGGKQLIFAVNVNMHNRIKENLIKAGIPEKEIAVVNANTTPNAAKRLKVADDYNKGKYKVVIGNYATMGEGLNFNNYTSDIHHLQPVWNYLQIEQGNGRGIRQGNELDVVNTHYYLGKKSIDGFMTDKTNSKGKMVNQFLRGESNLWDDESAMDPDDMLIELADNEEEARRLINAKQEGMKKAVEERQHEENFDKLREYFEIREKINRKKNLEPDVAGRMKEKMEKLKDHLLKSEIFSHKDKLDLTETPIILPKSHAVLPIGSVVTHSVNDMDSDKSSYIITKFNPRSKKITMRRLIPGVSYVDQKEMSLKNFEPQYGKTVKPGKMKASEIFENYLGESKTTPMQIIESMIPKEILHSRKYELKNSMLNIPDDDYVNKYQAVLIRDENSNLKFHYLHGIRNQLASGKAELLFPFEVPDFPLKALEVMKRNPTDSSGISFLKDYYSIGYERGSTDEITRVKNKLLREIEKLKGTPREDEEDD